MSPLRLLLSSLVISVSVAACSQDESATTAVESAPVTALQNAKIEKGMTQEEVKAILGDPQVIQSRSIDALTITYSEWVDATGTTTVQFQNDKVTFNQFFPANAE